MSSSEEFWDRKAESYSRSAVSDEEAYNKKLAETQKHLSSDMRILEFGCGTGTTAIHHAPHVAHIDAIDISGNMLEIARAKATAAKVDNISFTRGTLSNFNADSNSMDAVLGLNILHLLPERAAALADVSRILKPGGVFISSTGCLGNSYLRFIKLLVPIGKMLNLLPDVAIITEAQLLAEIEDVGLKVESSWRHSIDGISVFVVARKLA